MMEINTQQSLTISIEENSPYTYIYIPSHICIHIYNLCNAVTMYICTHTYIFICLFYISTVKIYKFINDDFDYTLHLSIKTSFFLPLSRSLFFYIHRQNLSRGYVLNYSLFLFFHSWARVFGSVTSSKMSKRPCRYNRKYSSADSTKKKEKEKKRRKCSQSRFCGK